MIDDTPLTAADLTPGMLVCTASAAEQKRTRLGGPRFPGRIGRIVGPSCICERPTGYWKVDLFAALGKVARDAVTYKPSELRRITVIEAEDLAPLVRAAAQRGRATRAAA